MLWTERLIFIISSQEATAQESRRPRFSAGMWPHGDPTYSHLFSHGLLGCHKSGEQSEEHNWPLTLVRYKSPALDLTRTPRQFSHPLWQLLHYFLRAQILSTCFKDNLLAIQFVSLGNQGRPSTSSSFPAFVVVKTPQSCWRNHASTQSSAALSYTGVFVKWRLTFALVHRR